MCQITPTFRSPPAAVAASVLLYRLPHGMKLVVAREDFCDVAACIAEDDEVLDKIKEATALKHALKDRLQFRRALGCWRIAQSPSARA